MEENVSGTRTERLPSRCWAGSGELDIGDNWVSLDCGKQEFSEI